MRYSVSLNIFKRKLKMKQEENQNIWCDCEGGYVSQEFNLYHEQNVEFLKMT